MGAPRVHDDGAVRTVTLDRPEAANALRLDVFRDAAPGDGRAIISRLATCLRAVRTAPVPMIARLNGACLGAAFELALACDLRVAHAGVRVGLPEVRLGIPSVVDATLLPRYVGAALAQEMVLTGNVHRVDEPGTAPLVNRMVDSPAGLGAAVDHLVAALLAPTREVLAAQKGLLETWREQGITGSVDAGVDTFAEVLALPATRDAIARYRP